MCLNIRTLAQGMEQRIFRHVIEEDSVLLKQDLIMTPWSYYGRERDYITDQTIYAYRNPPSHQAYYEQTNRFSLERICEYKVVKVKPADQNLDSAFVPKRLWATYCG